MIAAIAERSRRRTIRFSVGLAAVQPRVEMVPEGIGTGIMHVGCAYRTALEMRRHASLSRMTNRKQSYDTRH